MNQTISKLICLIAVSSFLLAPSSFVWADGGAIRLSERQGRYRITVFTTPTPLRAGPVDISVLVQDAVTEGMVSDIQVAIKAASHGSPAVILHDRATTEAATNKLYSAANFDLPEPGWYSVDVSIEGALGQAQVRFDMEAAEPMPAWRAIWPWLGWPFLAILLFGIHEYRSRHQQGKMRPD